MDFTLSEEQEMLKKSARDFLADKCPKSYLRQMEIDKQGYSTTFWKEMAELGWQGLVLPELYGGSGMEFIDLAVLLEEMGRVCLPGPFFSTIVLGAMTILENGDEKQKAAYLPGIASGKIIVTMALNEADGLYKAGSIAVYSIGGEKRLCHQRHQVVCSLMRMLPIISCVSPGPATKRIRRKVSPFSSCRRKIAVLNAHY